MIKEFITSNKKMNIKQGSYFWNTCSGTLSAFQSVLFLMIITRVLNIVEAGIFTIAYTNANLFANIGRYGVRNYQATDVSHKFSFCDYLISRYISTGIMVVISCGYLFFVSQTRSYPLNKTVIILAMCISKVLDSVEDVYYGHYQSQNRLDIAAKILTARLLMLYVSFIAILIIFKNLVLAIVMSTLISAVIVIYGICITKKEGFLYRSKYSIENIKHIFISCFPLFVGTFLSFYITNAPKYAIDAQLDETVQACYGFISMPIFVISLMNNFVFQPMITNLAISWEKKEYSKFIKSIWIECLILFCITLIAVLGGYLLGIPVLSILYKTNLSSYKGDLLILLCGGGMLALSGFFIVVLTIVRMQKDSVWGYIITAILAYILSPILVSGYGIRGASLLYLILMSLSAMIFGGMIIYKVLKMKNV